MMNLESKYPIIHCVVFFITFSLFASCGSKEITNLTDYSGYALIPLPAEIINTDGSYQLSNQIPIRVSNAELEGVGNYLIQSLGARATLANKNDDTGIMLSLAANEFDFGDEGYELLIEEELVSITARHPHGVFNGIQTFLQLVPADPNQAIASGKIVDYPRYSYRGSMLDVSRHFFGVADVKRYIDFLARYKMNVLHLHLTDDQGWRIEIKSKPELTTIGSTSEVGNGPGGYYTQEQYQEIVRYAGDRFITIIPEIDMPGHTQAALASYAELNCDGKQRELYRGTEVGFSTLCTSDEATYEFVEAVIREIAAITPGKYIHIGGDESHVTAENDYIYFVNRVQQIVSKYGKTMIGWDEIALADIEASTIVQQWNSAGNAGRAAKNGNKIILSPAKRAYMDMKYNETTRIGLSWASFIEVDHGYNWNPGTISAEIPSEVIVGIEAPLWTETVENMEDIEYLVFPRLPGYAEIGWSLEAVRSWDGYRQRLARHARHFEEQQINYYRSPLVDW